MRGFLFSLMILTAGLSAAPNFAKAVRRWSGVVSFVTGRRSRRGSCGWTRYRRIWCRTRARHGVRAGSIEFLKEAERRVLLDWLNPTIAQAAKQAQSKGGRVVVRRLNQREYQNTMRDLLAIWSHAGFPAGRHRADGMRNNGIAADECDSAGVLSGMITTEPAPPVFKHRFEKSTSFRRASGGQ